MLQFPFSPLQIGSFFLLNIILVIISVQFGKTKKRELELVRLRQELEAAGVQNEQAVQQLKARHQEAVGEMSAQVERLVSGKNV